MKYIIIALTLFASLSYGEPRVEFVKKADTLEIQFFNDTGKELRHYITGEALRKPNDPNESWTIYRLVSKADGYFGAGEVGRKEQVGSTTIPNISKMIPDHFDRKRIRVILEWSDGKHHEWTESKATVFYYEIF